MTIQTDSPIFWDTQYDNGRIPWDLGHPVPVFRRLAESGNYAPGKMIVLGAGRGFDARLFSGHGFQVTAVDFAPQAIQAMQELDDPEASVNILQQDIFDLPRELDYTFDYLLEYTCFCAIHPRRREAYFDLVARLLKPGGIYIALAFPIGTRSGGPPFVVSPGNMVGALQERGFVLQNRERPFDSVPSRHGIEELLVMVKETSKLA